MGNTVKQTISVDMSLFLCLLCNMVLVNSIQTPDPRVIYDIPSNITSTPGQSDCLKKTIKAIFRKIDRVMITIPIYWMDSAAYNIQEDLVKYLNKDGNWTIQLLSEPPHTEFHSSEICYSDLTKQLPVKWCQRHFILKEITHYYVIIIDDLSQLEEKLYSVHNSTSFGPEAKYVIYYYRLHKMNISKMIPIIHKYMIYTVVVIDHEVKSEKQSVFVFKLKLDGTGICLQESNFFSVGTCQTVRFSVRINALLRSRFLRTLKNCTIQGLAMRYEPFVINEKQGIEMQLLRVMSEYINASFDMTVTLKSEDWGDKVNGTWGGNFNQIVNSLKIGIGNVGPEADRIDDFDFTYSHLSARLVWVVPIAKYIKKWRVLTIIFKLDVWGICFGVLLFIAVFLIISSRTCDDIAYFRSFSGGSLASLQILITNSVYKIPKTDLVRLSFATGLIFALIMTCVYTSSLINVLTNVIREHQINNENEIVESDLQIGGLEEYKERFQNAEDDGCADDICRRYQFYTGENDTAQVWLEKVERGVACTPLPRSFVQYYMIRSYETEANITNTGNALTDEIGRIKLFIIDTPINFYSLAIVMKKGNPLRRIFDRFMKKFVEAGLVYTLISVYANQFKKLDYLIANFDDGPEQLSLYHLQGSFAILGIGYIISIFIFSVEILMCCRKKIKYFKRKNKVQTFIYAKIDPKNRTLYIDKKYGDMYGKTYPSFIEKRFSLQT